MNRPHATLTEVTDTTTGGRGDSLDAVTPGGRGRRFARRGVRGLGAVSVAIVVFVVVGAAVQVVAERRDAAARPAPGDLVDVGDGRRIHLQVSGEQHPGPTVVLDAGLMGFSPIWAWVQRDVAEHATVVSYDRAGLGWSDPRADGASADGFVADLHAALDARGLDGPYVLVGHSFGGLVGRAFAAAHADDVAGLVLVDPGHEDGHAELGEAYTASVEDGRRLMALAHAATRVGLTRLYNPFVDGLEDLPDAEVAYAMPRLVRTGYLAAVREEARSLDEVSDALREADADLGDRPVRIVSAGTPQPGMAFPLQAVHDLHRGMTGLSSDATHHVVDPADHVTLITRREHAEQVSGHVLDVVARTR